MGHHHHRHAAAGNGAHGASEKEEDPWKNLPEKNTHWRVPESVFDSLPEWEDREKLPGSLEITKFDLAELIRVSKLPRDAPELEKEAQRLLRGLQEHRTVVLSMSPKETEDYQRFLEDWHEFLAQPDLKKKGFYYPPKKRALYLPNEKPLVAPNAEPINSGYEQLYFDNRHNFRDEEWRDVYLLFGGDVKRPEIGACFPSDKLRDSMLHFASLFWSGSLAILALLEVALGLPPNELANCLVTPKAAAAATATTQPEFGDSINSNFAVFHYYDDVEAKKVKKPYDCTQKCMVHRDSGFVTLLPRATQPGIQALCLLSEPNANAVAASDGAAAAGAPASGYWIEMERYTKPGEVVVYTGRMLEMKTEGAIRPLIHRVVRQPLLERMSSPFEAKPDDETVIVKDYNGKPATVESVNKAMMWESLQRRVFRADGIPPEEHHRHLNGEYKELLCLYGDMLVSNE